MWRIPMGPFSIWHVPMGPTVTHPWCLQFVIKVSARSFLHPTCTCGTLLHQTSGTRPLMCHVYLWDLSLSSSDLWDPTACVSLVDPFPSDLWDPMAHVLRVPMGPFSISIRPMGPNSLRVTCTLCAAGFNKLKKPIIPRNRTRDLEQEMDHLYHYARFLVVLTCF